jgi:Domain of unknown function (DUF4160)
VEIIVAGGRGAALNPSTWEFPYKRIVPTVLRIGGLRVVIYPNDHRPAHVHVIGPGCEAVFPLNCPAGPVELRENYGFSRREIKRISDVLTQHLDDLCGAWEEIHGIV